MKKERESAVPTSEDYLMLDGQRYSVKFLGYEPATYSHKTGCLAYNNSTGSCQCNAIGRASKYFGVLLPGKKDAS